ncbi:MAG: hypothetical protein ACJAXM_001667 [Arenicella sp.]
MSVRWGLSKYILKTVVRWPEGTVIYHPFLNETLMLEDDVEMVFTAFKGGSLSVTDLYKNEKLQSFLEGLNEELSLKHIDLIVGELLKNELIEIVTLD